jgi:transcriptional regulator with XRE-family HTH domain
MNIITYERNKKEISQSELARRTNLNRGYISRIENGLRMPSPETIDVLAKVLDICPFKIYNYFYLNNKCTILNNNDIHCDIYNCTECLDKL